jgi:hypothetical protein
VKCCFLFVSPVFVALNAWIKQCIYLYINYHHALPKHFLKYNVTRPAISKMLRCFNEQGDCNSQPCQTRYLNVSWMDGAPFLFYVAAFFAIWLHTSAAHLLIWFKHHPLLQSKAFMFSFFVNFKLVKLTGRLDYFGGTTQCAFQTRVDLIFPFI